MTSMARIEDVRRVARTGPALVRGIVAWPVASQQVARRNALVAATTCADRRREREEVEQFLLLRSAPAAPARTTAEVRGA